MPITDIPALGAGQASTRIQLRDEGEGVFSLRLCDEASGNTLSAGLIGELLEALQSLRAQGSLKVLILCGTVHSFAQGGRSCCNEAVRRKLYERVSAFEYPIIAAMHGDALGAGFLLGALCDLMVCSETGRYEYGCPTERPARESPAGTSNAPEGVFASEAEEQLLVQRLGRARALDFLYGAGVRTGRVLQKKGWSCPIVPAAQVEQQARRLALSLAKKSQQSLRLLKPHLTREVLELTRSLRTAERLPALELTQALKSVAGLPVLGVSEGGVELQEHAGHVLLMKMTAQAPHALAEDLSRSFARIESSLRNGAWGYRAIVLSGEGEEFIPEACDEQSLLSLQRALLQAPLPVVAVLRSSQSGWGWLLSQFCDSVCYSGEGRYCAAALLGTPALRSAAAKLFAYRLGPTLGAEIVLSGESYRGLKLQERQCALNVAGEAEVFSRALELAQWWAHFPLETLLEWKSRTCASLRQQLLQEAQFEAPGAIRTRMLSATQPVEVGPDDCRAETGRAETGAIDEAALPLELNSPVISATVELSGVAVVRMQDRSVRNMFSTEFIQGLREAFEKIAADARCKVVVLIGYDKYFASGGTHEQLIAIQQGRARFTDDRTYRTAVDCALPVIACLQGHGVGGGFSLGLFADVVLLSEESQYLSPYMSYGFTPGTGATLIVPERLGEELGRESLLSAQEYTGSELRRRGVGLSVYPRKQIEAQALRLARQIARQPRAVLIEIKEQLSAAVRARLVESCEREVAMHERSLVGQADTLMQIQSTFDPMGSAAQSSPVATGEPVAPRRAAGASRDSLRCAPVAGGTLGEIAAVLKELLAQELQMPIEQVDEDTQFTDLGLDSVTGVTWIRKVNEKYQTSILATKVYSFPTLKQFSSHVQEQIAKAGAMGSAAQLSPVAVGEPVAPRRAAGASRDSLRCAPVAGGTLGEITAVLKELLAQELQMPIEQVDEDTQFTDLGLDSVTGVTWIRKVNEKYQTSILATKVYSFPTLNQFSSHVQEQAGALRRTDEPARRTDGPAIPEPASISDSVAVAHSVAPATQKSAARLSPKRRAKLISWDNGQTSRVDASTVGNGRTPRPAARGLQPIAVIGMAGQFPKAASVEQFWDNIAQGRDCISEVPRERWDVDAYFREGEPQLGKTNSRWMGALEEYDRFDPLFFSLSPVEAQSMDPQQRLFLQACWHCIEHAGYDARVLSGSRCGVFVGCAPGDYHELAPEQRLTAQAFTGRANSILAARISYFLNLQGPCLSIDTACSSSLVAIAQGCDSLLAGESDAVLAGGVALMAGPEMHIMAAQAGMLSPAGRCFTFDQRANGFVPAEAVGVVMLKRLADALEDHDTIYGLIQGWGVNQDGKTNGITAPNPESQTRLQQHVYEKYRIDPAGIQLVEAHGTGTRLGDPIEVEGLCGSFGKYTGKRSFCALGSVKSNIGHCMAAAGIAGFIKVVMALKNQQLPPTIHFERLNEHIALADSPFYVNDRLRDWPLDAAETRRAAISSFGFSGTNAHLVLGEYLPARRAQAPAGVSTGKPDILVPLSARTAEQLDHKTRDLLDWIHAQPDLDLTEMAYTLQVGREAMEERLGFVANSIGQLTQKLQAYVTGTRDIEGTYRGQVARGKERVALLTQDADIAETVIKKYIADGKPAKLLNLWVNGLDVGWNRLYGQVKPRRIALPLYPFAKERCWIDTAQSGHAVARSMTTSMLHPLLHTNTSDFSAQSYRSVFSGEESFLADHRIRTSDGTLQRVLPGVAYLEMARAALEQAMPDRAAARVVELRHIVWLQPLVVTASTEVSITLSVDEADELAVDEIVYEIHSHAGGQRTTHCQGRAVLGTSPAVEQIDVAKLQAQMTHGSLDSGSLYALFARMGLEYGPAHRGVEALYQGGDQLLASLRLPAAVARTRQEYLLHPSLLDSALQAAIGLSLDPERYPGRPPLPFSLESLRILSACEADMFAWVRRSPGSRPADAPAVDIDLCDRQGRICVRIRGFTSRILAAREKPSAFDSEAYRKLIEKVSSREISIEAAVEFG